MRLWGHDNNAGGRRAAQHVLQALDEKEVTQVADLEGGLQAVLRQAPGLSAHSCITHQDVQGPEVGGGQKIKHVCLWITSDNKEDSAANKRGFSYHIRRKRRWGEATGRRNTKKEDVIVRSQSRGSTQGVLFQSVVDFRGLQRQSISNADMIQRFSVQLPMARQVL